MTISVNSKKKQVKKTFDELLMDLKTSNSEKVRYNAARILGEMGDSKAVEPLIDVLKNDKNGSVRLYAARALGELGDCKATTHLIESLREDRNVDVRVRAARALGRLGGAIVVEPLVEALNDENPQVCITATDALIEIGDVATDALIASLDHEKVNVRCDATRALGEIGNKKAVDKVINMLYDEWVNVRIYAVTSLGKLNDPKAVPALIDVMKNRNENELVRAGAAAALGVLRDQRALLPLRELIMEAEELGELEEISLAYACTIHKAQGSEYPIIIIPMTTSHFIMLKRNLLYTGVTRAQKICVLVGNKYAISKATENNESEKRYTLLQRRLDF